MVGKEVVVFSEAAYNREKHQVFVMTPMPKGWGITTHSIRREKQYGCFDFTPPVSWV